MGRTTIIDIAPSRSGDLHHHLIHGSLGTKRVSVPNGISIWSAVVFFAELTLTDTQTNHATPSIGLYCYYRRDAA